MLLFLKVPLAYAERFHPAIEEGQRLLNGWIASDDWTTVVIPIGTAYVLLLAWGCTGVLVQRLSKRWAGQKLDSYGAPLWIDCAKLWTQLFVLPLVYWCALRSHAFDMERWRATAERSLFTETGERHFDWAFCYIFVAYMLVDFRLFELDAVMRAHHVACIVGVLFGFVIFPSGFPYFSSGILALEVGSAALNIFCIFPTHPVARSLYFVLMSASNLVAMCLCWTWMTQEVSASGKAASLILTAGFLAMRQKEVARNWRSA